MARMRGFWSIVFLTTIVILGSPLMAAVKPVEEQVDLGGLRLLGGLGFRF